MILTSILRSASRTRCREDKHGSNHVSDWTLFVSSFHLLFYFLNEENEGIILDQRSLSSLINNVFSSLVCFFFFSAKETIVVEDSRSFRTLSLFSLPEMRNVVETSSLRSPLLCLKIAKRVLSTRERFSVAERIREFSIRASSFRVVNSKGLIHLWFSFASSCTIVYTWKRKTNTCGQTLVKIMQ